MKWFLDNNVFGMTYCYWREDVLHYYVFKSDVFKYREIDCQDRKPPFWYKDVVPVKDNDITWKGLLRMIFNKEYAE